MSYLKQAALRVVKAAAFLNPLVEGVKKVLGKSSTVSAVTPAAVAVGAGVAVAATCSAVAAAPVAAVAVAPVVAATVVGGMAAVAWANDRPSDPDAASVRRFSKTAVTLVKAALALLGAGTAAAAIGTTGAVVLVLGAAAVWVLTRAEPALADRVDDAVVVAS